MSRHTARENLFKLIYEWCVTGEKNALTFNLVFSAEEDAQKPYMSDIYNGLDSKFDFLKNLVADFAKDFSADRIYKVDMAILLLASYEILFAEEIPDTVAINEAVELAKIYSTPKSSVFINGLLASIKKNKEEILENEKDGANN